MQLLHLSEEWKQRIVDPRNPILPHVPFLYDIALKWYVNFVSWPILFLTPLAPALVLKCGTLR